MPCLHPFPRRGTGNFSFLEIWFGFFSPSWLPPKICPHLRTGCNSARLSLTPRNKGLQTGACCSVRQRPFGKGRESLALLVCGITRTSQHQSLENVLGCPWCGWLGTANLLSQLCLPSFLSSSDALEEMKGVKRAGDQSQPRAAAISS